jgi:hypothetical protein
LAFNHRYGVTALEKGISGRNASYPRSNYSDMHSSFPVQDDDRQSIASPHLSRLPESFAGTVRLSPSVGAERLSPDCSTARSLVSESLLGVAPSTSHEAISPEQFLNNRNLSL